MSTQKKKDDYDTVETYRKLFQSLEKALSNPKEVELFVLLVYGLLLSWIILIGDLPSLILAGLLGILLAANFLHHRKGSVPKSSGTVPFQDPRIRDLAEAWILFNAKRLPVDQFLKEVEDAFAPEIKLAWRSYPEIVETHDKGMGK